MIISGSFLKIQDNKKNIDRLNDACDMIHYDIMDGLFTERKTLDNIENTKDINKPVDVHLMVKDVKKYVDYIYSINPKYITFHLEVSNTLENIDYIKNKNVKVGLAINPETKVEDIYDYLKTVDLVLLLSVHPGSGGQKFININDKIEKLYNYRNDNNLSFKIEVDGGINDETIKNIKKADIAVVGSYITDSNNYKEKVEYLRRII